MFGGRSDLKFNDRFLEEFPNTREYILKTLQEKHPEIQELGPNEEYEIKSSSFDRTPYAFVDNVSNPNGYYKILGIQSGKRVWKWIKKDYLTPRYPERNNINHFKVFIAKADGAAGTIGKPIPARIIGKPIVAGPGTSSIPSFISIGIFDTEQEAKKCREIYQNKACENLVRYSKGHSRCDPGQMGLCPSTRLYIKVRHQLGSFPKRN